MNAKITKINLISKRKAGAMLNSFLGKFTLFVSLIVLITIVHFLPMPAFATNNSISVTTDKLSYSYGDTIVISGFVNPVLPNQTITITLTSPSEKSGSIQVSPDASGNYSLSISITGMNYPTGTYIVIGTYAGAQSTTTFTYVGSQPGTAQFPSSPQTTENSSSQTSTIPSTTVPQAPTTTASTRYDIPDWVKNDAKWWGEGQIPEGDFVKAIQYMIDNNILTPNQAISEINQLQQENDNLRTENGNLKSQIQYDSEYIKQYQANVTNALQQYQANVTNTVQRLECLPMTTIRNQTIDWHFCDSKGNQYDWEYKMSGYDAIVKQPIYIPNYSLQLPNGQSVSTSDYTQFVNTISQDHDFSKVIDRLYDNAGSDEQFIYEVSYVVSEMTTYSKDMTNYNLWPFEVLTRGEGDCKDKAILMADMLRSSSHTGDWKIDLVILDIDHPTDPQAANHMIVYVDTGTQKYYVESTATPDINALNVWTGIDLYGWHIPFGNSQ